MAPGPLPLFTCIFLLAWPDVFFWHYHLMHMALIQPYGKVHAGCTGHMIIARMCMKISKRPGEDFTIFLDGKQLSQEVYSNYLGSIL